MGRRGRRGVRRGAEVRWGGEGKGRRGVRREVRGKEGKERGKGPLLYSEKMPYL